MNIQNIIDKVKSHAADAGRTPKSVLRSATGNAHAWSRLLRMKKRAETIDRQVDEHIQSDLGSQDGCPTEAAE